MTTTATATFIVITIILLLITGLAVYAYYKEKGLEGIRKYVYDWILEAEEKFEHGDNTRKLDYVVQLARSMLPGWMHIFVTESTLKAIVNLWFKEVKNLLDYQG